MNKMTAQLSYMFSVYIKSNKIIMPALCWLVLLAGSYFMIPVYFVSSAVMSGIWLFYLMVWISFTYFDMEEDVAEQLIFLKVGTEGIYYGSRYLFLALIGVVFGIVGTLYPMLLYLVNGAAMYTRTVSLSEYGAAFFVQLLAALLGISAAGLFQRRIIKNRKLGILLTAAFSLLAVIKGAMVEKLTVLKYLLWVFPPVDDFGTRFAGKEYFAVQDMMIMMLQFLLYISVYLMFQIWYQKRNKF